MIKIEKKNQVFYPPPPFDDTYVTYQDQDDF